MRAILFLILTFYLTSTLAQVAETDSLKNLLSTAKDSQARVSLYENISYAYLSSFPDTAMQYALKGLQLSKDIQWLHGETICTDAIANVYFHIGDNAKALELYLQYLQLKEQAKNHTNISVAYYNIAGVYTEEKDYRNALLYFFKALKLDEKNKDSSAYLYDMYSLGSVYLRMEKNDSALFYMNKAYALVQQLHDENMIGAVLNTLGEIYLSLQKTDEAVAYYRQSKPYAEAVQEKEVISADDFGMAKVYKEKKQIDSTIWYARRAYETAYEGPFFKQALEISSFISTVYKEQKRFDSAFYYQQLSINIKDSLFNAANVAKVQNLKFDEQQRQQSILAQKIQYRNNIQLLIVVAVSIILLVIAILLWHNYRVKQKANERLEWQKTQIEHQKEKVELTLSELKSTQAQLIQSEKMASLGELTAGIAHEIQNPLNFVNNFSELNNELIEEMNGETDAEEIKIIAADIKQNNEKIAFHGKRADAIVKGMLQHSRKNTGQKEATGINVLCDEYLRLSYHGLRAKDKNFNADFTTDFDETIGKMNVVPQDVGRVLLNLFNNAFYAVKEKKKNSDETYHPQVSVHTKKVDDKVEIRVEDNGNGIPQTIIDKVFQPFFTTKPTGQGTGLGLSLSYDIITKEHSGTIAVESKENCYTRFIITLPV